MMGLVVIAVDGRCTAVTSPPSARMQSQTVLILHTTGWAHYGYLAMAIYDITSGEVCYGLSWVLFMGQTRAMARSNPRHCISVAAMTSLCVGSRAPCFTFLWLSLAISVQVGGRLTCYSQDAECWTSARDYIYVFNFITVALLVLHVKNATISQLHLSETYS